MNTNNKRIRVENWLKKNKKYIKSRTIDNELEIKNAVTHFLQENRKINDDRILILFKFIKNFTAFNLKKNLKRENVEHWLKKNQSYIVRNSFDDELILKSTVRHFLYNGRRINSEQINILFSLIKKINLF